jgi:hypothetical protein
VINDYATREVDMLRNLVMAFCFVCVAFVADASAAVWHVDLAGTADFVSIQAAVTNAAEGDEIIVHQGTYNEAVSINKTNLILRSTNPLDPAVVAVTKISMPNAIVISLASYSSLHLAGLHLSTGRCGVSGGSADCLIERCTIVSNRTGNALGAGIANCAGTIQYNLITDNIATNYGGALYQCAGTIQHNAISRNTVNAVRFLYPGNGGGLSVCNGTIQYNTISGNSASYYGGGLYQCSGTIQYNTISGNSASSDGGGLYYCSGTTQYNKISGNSATYGGGLSVYNGTIQYNTISGNSASTCGGGLTDRGGITRNNLIVDNTSSSTGGGIIIWGTTQIQNNTIVRNFATSSGGGIYNGGSSQIGIFNNILWNNLAGQNSQYGWDSTYQITPHYCCIQAGSSANNCITSNPQFVGVNDFHLKTNSPCTDVGYNLPGVFTWTDLDGGERVVNEIVDIGCYEFGSIPEPFAIFVPLAALWIIRARQLC